MIRIPICPVCDEPVVDQPDTDWTSAYRGGRWWHLADNSPACAAADGSFPRIVFVDDGPPVDGDTSAWLHEMSHLFTIDGPGDPTRLRSAITAAEHLSHWLHTATGPFSALLALPTPSDVTSLIGHLHRTTRLLARVHAQTASHLLDQARQADLHGGDSEGWSETGDAAGDIHGWLQDAAGWSAQSARAAGIAWSIARKTATPPVVTPACGSHEVEAVKVPAARRPTMVTVLRGVGRWLRQWARPATTTDSPPTGWDVAQLPDDLSPAQLAALIGSTFYNAAAFSPELTRAAGQSVGILAAYLSQCLGLARPAAIPTAHDLADLVTSLTGVTHALISGLRHLADSPRGSESDGLDEADVAATRASLRNAVDALRVAAGHLAAVSYSAAGPDPQESQR
jgi:hypothetical protein